LARAELSGTSDTFSVKVFESAGNAVPFVFACGIWAEVSKRGNEDTPFASIPVLLFDDSDCSFIRRYPRSRWLSDNLLQFVSTSEAQEKVPVRVINKSDRQIKLLRIYSNDIYLVIGIEPFETFSIEASSSGFISVYGILEPDIKVMKEFNLSSFSGDGGPGICISVDATEIRIARPPIPELGHENSSASQPRRRSDIKGDTPSLDHGC
jgi:hypothetical protein